MRHPVKLPVNLRISVMYVQLHYRHFQRALMKTEQPTRLQIISVALILYVCQMEVLKWATLLWEDQKWPISSL